MAPDGPSPGGDPIFSRESVLGGMPARRASTLLYAIENRSALLTARSRSAMARFETERSLADREQLFLGALAEGRTPPLRPTIQDIDRHAGSWADLVPADPSLRAAIAKRLVDKYGLPSQAQGIRKALGAGDPAVEAAYARQADGASLAGAGRVPLRTRERLRWMRASVAARLESLPPFWLAYALTLTETVGGGILALPIALAAFGPLGATAVLVFFGIVNTLTVAALVEAITRNGNMRYGNAFFGRLIGDYLGRPGNLVAMPALFALDAVGFCVALVGFGITIGGVTGLPAAVCASLLFGVTLVILWRGSLDATVALAVAVGLLNLLLIVVLSLLALTHAQPAGSGPGTTFVLDASVLNLIFGVALVAYFGHTSAGHAAKVVLARDPGGRHLLAGNVAAMVTAMVVLRHVRPDGHGGRGPRCPHGLRRHGAHAARRARRASRGRHRHRLRHPRGRALGPVRGPRHLQPDGRGARCAAPAPAAGERRGGAPPGVRPARIPTRGDVRDRRRHAGRRVDLVHGAALIHRHPDAPAAGRRLPGPAAGRGPSPRRAPARPVHPGAGPSRRGVCGGLDLPRVDARSSGCGSGPRRSSAWRRSGSRRRSSGSSPSPGGAGRSGRGRSSNIASNPARRRWACSRWSPTGGRSRPRSPSRRSPGCAR